ncbi:hypothetical protein ACSXEL_17175 (plasmid) [Clostridium perfringens]
MNENRKREKQIKFYVNEKENESDKKESRKIKIKTTRIFNKECIK